MAKVSSWKIIATEGPTVDRREITRQWIEQMAESYSMTEYTALIWPEHRRFYGYGDNWGKVVELKAEELDGKMRLYAKIQPNQYLLEANRNEQKLFTSIEPDPDYKGQGTCYLTGLAVTDSPASSGTSLLQFSAKKQGKTQIESNGFEELSLEECFSKSEKFFAMAKTFFASEQEQPEPEEIDVDEKKLVEILNQQFSQQFGTLKIDLKELKAELLTELEEKFSKQPQADEQETPEVPEKTGMDAGQFAEAFSKAFEENFKPFEEKLDAMDEKFNKLSKEVPGQEPQGTGAGGDGSYMPL